MMTRTKDKTKTDVEGEEIGTSPRDPLLEFYDILSSRSVGDLTFNINKDQISLSPVGIKSSRGEMERYFHLITDFALTLASMSLEIEGLRKINDKDPLVTEYDALSETLKSCNLFVTGFADNPSGRGYSIAVSIGQKKDGDNDLGEVKASDMEVKYDSIKYGLKAQAENGYRILNCGALQNWFRARCLAVKCELISIDDGATLKGSGVDKKGADDYLTRTKKQLGG